MDEPSWTSILRRCRAHGVRLVRLLYCGLDGVVRGRACHVDFLKEALRSGVAVNAALLTVNSFDRPVTDSLLPSQGSIYLVPARGTFAMLPYANVYCDLGHPGWCSLRGMSANISPSHADPRQRRRLRIS